MRYIKYLLFVLLLLPIKVFAIDNYSDTFKRFTENGDVYISGVDPQDIDIIGEMVWSKMMDVLGTGIDDSYAGRNCTVPGPGQSGPPVCDTEKQEGGYYLINAGLNTNTPNPEYHVLHVYFEDENLDNNMTSKASGLKTTLSNNEYLVTDLGFVNFIYNIPTGKNETDLIDYSILYSKSLIDTIGNQNILFKFLPGYGGNLPLDTYAEGNLTLSYKDSIYGVATQVRSRIKNVIYVPNDTESNDDALIEAALVRIYDYLGINEGFTIEAYKTLQQVLANGDGELNPYNTLQTAMSEIYPELTNLMIYRITVNGNTFYTFIEKNSSAMTTPYLNVNDENNNIKIETNNGLVPLDVNFNANYITSHEDIETIKSHINGDFVAIDLSLYSYVKGSFITNINNGKFIVSIPVPNSLNGKTIKVYYITDNGELEEHDANVENGLAIFETDHFSTYIVAEQQTVNPKTADTIIKNVILLLISIVSLITTSISIKKRLNY